jgi:hypothetical protein
MLTDQIIEGTIARLHIGWTQGHQAEDAEGEAVDPASPDAVAWCLTGAINAAMEALGIDFTTKANRRLFSGTCYRVGFAPSAGYADEDWEQGIVGAAMAWNDDDERTVEDVILACKEALVS